jgi:ribosomal protein L20A (L18A)
MLSGLAAARGLGETVTQLANIIINKANAYETAYANILGTYQAKQKAIDIATTIEEIQAIN